MTEKSLSVDLCRGVMNLRPQKIVVRTELDIVVMFVDNKRVELSTTVAHDIGYSLVTKSAEGMGSEFIRLSINGEDVDLLPLHARQVGAALLRKADDADDFQLSNKRM